MKETNLILKTASLTVGYSNKDKVSEVLKDANVSLYEGTLVALIGANGSGKSTFLRTICGLQSPLSGDILLNNTKLTDHTSAQLAKSISVVLTEKLPPGNLTVFELVALGRQPYTNWLGTLSQKDKTIVETALAHAGVAQLRDKKHYEISDGQLQRVLIARALAQDTPLIVLDEPTTHLDLQHKLRLMQLLRELTRGSGKSILFSTHDIDSAIEFCDELLVVTVDGIQQGSPAEIVQSGVFDRLFEDTRIRFDKVSQRFTIDEN